MKSISLTVLTENTAQGHGLLAEHGLSFWINIGTQHILFDTGQTDVLCHNASLLGIELSSADAIVLSHGHYDHTGGLYAVLNKVKEIKVFAHPETLSDKYAQNRDGTARDIGIPVKSKKTLQNSATLVPTESPTETGDGFVITGPIPRTTDYENTGGPFFKDKTCQQPDDLVDDQAAFLDTPSGIIVILGCAHAGIINTLKYIKQLLPKRPIHTVIGGTHLLTANETRMTKTIAALREMNIQRLLPLHCTGFAAAARLWKEFPNHVALCPVGTMIKL
ncbi:MAG: MBL fold metallo-hydrolase [Lentisphaerae bacterium]|nr:MBL fold metallo-hydrolase [Lentisphaerota bacterium]